MIRRSCAFRLCHASCVGDDVFVRSPLSVHVGEVFLGAFVLRVGLEI